MAISPVKVGISGSLIALVACGVWFLVTDQATKISQRAWHAQEENDRVGDLISTVCKSFGCCADCIKFSLQALVAFCDKIFIGTSA